MESEIKETMNETMNIKSNVVFKLYDEKGKLKLKRVLHNTATTHSKSGVADQLLDSPTLPVPGWVELGTGTPAATLLGAYIPGSRTAFDSKTRLLNVVTTVTTFGPGVGTGTITEAGMFDVVTQNTINMWASATGFTAIPKGAGDTLVVTWILTIN